jgi:hypothetical protein
MRTVVAALLVAACGGPDAIPDATSDATVDSPVDAPNDGEMPWMAPTVPSNLVGAYVKATNTGLDDQFGAAIAISADGTTLAVGAPAEQSAAITIDGDQTDNSLANAGAVYVYAWNGTAWAPQAYIKAWHVGLTERFGTALSLSGDGNTLAVGVPDEDRCATGVDDPDPTEMGCGSSGAVFTFVRSGSAWMKQSYLKASNANQYQAVFGASVALSSDGSTLAVGATLETNGTGAVFVFTRSGASWMEQARLTASNAQGNDNFGLVALSADGNVLAVGAIDEDSAATTVGGNANDNSKTDAGAAYVFSRTGTNWTQEAYVKASNSGATDNFGQGIALSANGETLVVGAVREESGIEGNQTDDSQLVAGAVYVFTKTGTWSQQAYLKSATPYNGDAFGLHVALAADGDTLAIGMHGDDRTGRGVDPTMTRGVENFGTVEVFERNGTAWSRLHVVKAFNADASDSFGFGVAISADGSVVAASAPNEASNATGIDGDATNNSTRSGAAYVIRY